ICVVETLPNYDSAKSFARRHHGKVFLAGYADMKDEMLRWGDGPKMDASERRTTDEARDRYTVTLDQYKNMQVSMFKFARRQCLFPDSNTLVQRILEKGQWRMSAVCKELAFLHFTRTALVAEKDDEQKKYRRKVVKVGLDPHTSYANMLCDVAWSRAHGTSSFILPTIDKPGSFVLKPENIGVKPLADVVHALREESLSGDVCGRCISFNRETSGCEERGFTVRPKDV